MCSTWAAQRLDLSTTGIFASDQNCNKTFMELIHMLPCLKEKLSTRASFSALPLIGRLYLLNMSIFYTTKQHLLANRL